MDRKTTEAIDEHHAKPDITIKPVQVKRNAKQVDEDDDKWRGGHHGYMAVKKRKLLLQFKNDARKATPAVGEASSSLFRGIAIQVNGNTSPNAEELKRLMMVHGGTYHLYYNSKKTTHIIASNLPYTKIVKLNAKAVVKPTWITESIRQGKLLPWRDFELYPVAAQQGFKLPLPVSSPVKEKTAVGGTEIALKAGDPNYVNQFYARSRLHHLSAWKVESKQLVQVLQDSCDGLFSGRERLRQHYAELPNRTTQAPHKVIMHIDFDCFFVSVGLLSRPHLKGKPIAVCHGQTGFGRKEGAKEGQELFDSKSEISSCSYEARKAGLKNGMYLGQAKQMCSELLQIPYEFEEYKRVSTLFYEIVANYTINIEAISCDEMLVDCTEVLTATCTSPVEFVGFLRREIFERTGCNASAGLGRNQLIARLATRLAKPNGQMYVADSEVKNFMTKIPVEDLPGVGRSSVEKFDKLDATDCGKLQAVPLEKLQASFGPKNGLKFFNFARGMDNREVMNDTMRKSVSADVNYGMRMTSIAQFEAFFKELSEEVARRLDTVRVKAHLMTLKLLVRHPDAPFEPEKFMGCGKCNAVNRSVSLIQPTNSAEIIATEGVALFKKSGVDVKEVRGIGLQLTRLVQNKAQKVEGKKTLTEKEPKVAPDMPPINVGTNRVGLSRDTGMAEKPSMAELPDAEGVDASDNEEDFDESQGSQSGSPLPVVRLNPPIEQLSQKKALHRSRKAIRYDIQAEAGWTRVYSQVLENLRSWASKTKVQKETDKLEIPDFLRHNYIKDALPEDEDGLNSVLRLVARNISASLQPKNSDQSVSNTKNLKVLTTAPELQTLPSEKSEESSELVALNIDEKVPTETVAAVKGTLEEYVPKDSTAENNPAVVIPEEKSVRRRTVVEEKLDRVAASELKRMTRNTEYKFWLNYFAVPEVASVTQMASTLHGSTLAYLDNPFVYRVNEMGGKFEAAKVIWAIWNINTAYEEEWLEEVEREKEEEEEQQEQVSSEIANPHAIQKQDTEIIVNAEAKNIVSPKKAHKQMLLDTNIAQESPPPKTPESEKAKAKIFVLSSPSEISEEVLINLPAAIRVEMYEAFIAQKKKAKAKDFKRPSGSQLMKLVSPVKAKKKLSQATKQPLVTDLFRSRKKPTASQDTQKRIAKVVDVVELVGEPTTKKEQLSEKITEVPPVVQITTELSEPVLHQAQLLDAFGVGRPDLVVRKIQMSIRSNRKPDEKWALQFTDFCSECCKARKISQLQAVVKSFHRELDYLQGEKRDAWIRMYEKVTKHIRVTAQKHFKSALKIPPVSV